MAFPGVFFDDKAEKIASPEVVLQVFRTQGDEHAAQAYELCTRLAAAYSAAGGRALMVGGSVRDMLLGRTPKDFDIEVYGLAPTRVEEILRTFGAVADAGKAFAILKLSIGGVDIDVALPRKEQKTGAGHKDFRVDADPALDPRDAARRRDFTINAIAADLLTGEIVDPFGGMKDLAGGVLRVVDPATFVEDPLRVLRAMQLAARFSLIIPPESFSVMQAMVPTLGEISSARIGEEWRKLLLLSERPSIGLRFGMDVGAFALLHPELPPLVGTPQEPEWHPEGNVWVHTMMVVDEAAKIVRRDKLDNDRAFTVLLGALCHDFGKPQVTAVEKGRIRSHGHEDAGVAPTVSFLETLSVHRAVIAEVVGIVRDHMKPYRLWHAAHEEGKPVSDGVVRRLAGRIAPARLCDLVCVAEADYYGRGPFPDPHDPQKQIWHTDYPAGEWLLGRGSALAILCGPAPHLISGGELIDLGYAPSPQFGEIIAQCDVLRDERGLDHYQIRELLRQVPYNDFGERDLDDALARLKNERN